ncbi:MAG: DegT/DnrJ/EryC1/StrS family aminotransferase [Candidatus Edwardsbacteria bacterium]|nr:DegT/DnrJ/EryC1/StrS family aminotransferase [Candidatus Edwardsbacteria bacterium]
MLNDAEKLKLLERPRRREFLPFSPPDIGPEEIDEVADSLRRGWLTTGRKVAKFEEQFASYVGSKHAVGLSSATAGLFLSLKSLGIGPGDEVITTPYTFIASINVILHAGAAPVLVDVKRNDFNIDPAKIAAAVTPRTRAVIPVHFAGRPCDMDAIGIVAAKNDLTVIEDAAHAIGAEYKEKKIGAISRLTVFSLHAVKNVTAAEGGMAATDDPALAERIRIMAMHGMNKDAWKRYAPGGTWRYDIVELGYKCNMMDLQAAIGIHQLAKVEKFRARRQEIVQRYRRGLEDLPELTLPDAPVDGRHALHLYPLLVDFTNLSITRDRMIELLAEENVSANVHFIPAHLFSYYRTEHGYKPGDFPVAEFLSDHEVTLPLYTRLSDDDADDVIAAVRRAIINNRK